MSVSKKLPKPTFDETTIVAIGKDVFDSLSDIRTKTQIVN